MDAQTRAVDFSGIVLLAGVVTVILMIVVVMVRARRANAKTSRTSRSPGTCNWYGEQPVVRSEPEFDPPRPGWADGHEPDQTRLEPMPLEQLVRVIRERGVRRFGQLELRSVIWSVEEAIDRAAVTDPENAHLRADGRSLLDELIREERRRLVPSGEK
jgi:hypothetical protein